MVRETGWQTMPHQKVRSLIVIVALFVKKNTMLNRLLGWHSSELSAVLAHNVCGLAMLPKTDAQKRDAVEVRLSSQIEKLNGNIAKPLVTCWAVN